MEIIATPTFQRGCLDLRIVFTGMGVTFMEALIKSIRHRKLQQNA